MTATVLESRVRGRALRQSLPRRAHALLPPADDASRDVIDVLTVRDPDRLPELVGVRYGRMLANPFAFYRGAVDVMSLDLSRQPHTGITVQLCGDAHAANFGIFATPERNLVFGVNDFDETLEGPWEWDVKRLATSLVVAGRVNGLTDVQCEEVVRSTCASYRARIQELAFAAVLDVWHAQVDVSALVSIAQRGTRAKVEALASRARRHDQARALERLTEVDADGQVRFRDEPPLLVPLDRSHAAVVEVSQVLTRYRSSLSEERRMLLGRYELVDAALKVVGIGSVGTRCTVALLTGPAGDHLVLQVKEAMRSTLEPYLGRSRFSNHGKRVVVGQRLMQAAPDLFLGWSDSPASRTHFYVRQLWDQKGSADIAAMSAGDLARYGAVCGAALARAHARSGEPALISGYLGRSGQFDAALVTFAKGYADRTEQQYQALVAAGAAGRVPVDYH